MSLLKTCVWAVLIGLAGSPVGAQTFRSVYSFPSDGAKGREPFATLTIGPEGDLYGTATAGGTEDAGTAFKVSPATDDVTILDHFDGETTGYLPYGRLLNIGDGYLYGVSEQSSFTSIEHGGTVYRLDPNAGITQVFQFPVDAPNELQPIPTSPRSLVSVESNTLLVLCADYPGFWRVPVSGSDAHVAYSFAEDSIDGGHARNILRGSDGYLYGTTIGSSDAGDFPNGRGTLFRVNPDGSGMTILHECQFTTGSRPHGTLTEATDGNFYGVMRAGAKGGAGCIFRLTPDGVYTILYHFGTQANDLRLPYGDLLLASDGQLYGTAREGGAPGYGGVFRIKTNGSGYTVLHVFNDTNGAYPEGGLVQAEDGNLYGTTTQGGTGGNGTIFKIKRNLPPPLVNRPPVAVDDVAVTTGNSVVIPILENDFDPDRDGLIVSIETAPTRGTAVVLAGGSIRYTPNGAPGPDEFTYTISDGRGGVSSATVRIRQTEPGPLVVSGAYNGLLMLDPNLDGQGDLPRAQFVVTVGSTGQFTGTLFTQRKRVKLRGSFNSKGFAVVNLKLPNQRAAALFLSFQSGDPNPLVGVLFGPELWSGVAGPLKSSGSTVTESYTVLLEPNPGVPPVGFGEIAEGYGYGVAQVRPNGLVGMVGKLGDGSKFSWGTTLISAPDAATIIPVFGEPMKDGVCGGFLTRSGGAGSGFLGTARWKRPGKPKKPYPLGFNGSATVAVAPFVPAASSAGVLNLVGGVVRVGGGPLAEIASGDFIVNGKKIQPSSPLRALSINRKSGLFSGKIQAGKKTLSFKGAVNQTLNQGGGQFSIRGETGVTTLDSGQVE